MPRLNLSLFPADIQDHELTPREKQLIDNLILMAAYAERQNILLTRLSQFGSEANTAALATMRTDYWTAGTYREKIWRLQNARAFRPPHP